MTRHDPTTAQMRRDQEVWVPSPTGRQCDKCQSDMLTSTPEPDRISKDGKRAITRRIHCSNKECNFTNVIHVGGMSLDAQPKEQSIAVQDFRNIEISFPESSAKEIEAMAEEYGKLSIEGVEDKIGYANVHSARMVVKKHRVAVDATRKNLKRAALDYNIKVETEAKRITALLDPIFDHLQAEEDRIDKEKASIKLAKENAARAKVQKRHDSLRAVNANHYKIEDVRVWKDKYFDNILEIETKRHEATKAKEAEEARLKVAREAAVRIKQEAEAKKLKEERAELDRIKAEQEELAKEHKIFLAREREKDEAAKREQDKRIAEERAELDRVEAKRQEDNRILLVRQKEKDDAIERERTEAIDKQKAEFDAEMKRFDAERDQFHKEQEAVEEKRQIEQAEQQEKEARIAKENAEAADDVTAQRELDEHEAVFNYVDNPQSEPQEDPPGEEVNIPELVNEWEKTIGFASSRGDNILKIELKPLMILVTTLAHLNDEVSSLSETIEEYDRQHSILHVEVNRVGKECAEWKQRFHDAEYPV